MIIKKNYLHFILISLITLLFAYEYNTFIQTDSLYAQSLSEKYTQEIITHALNLRHQWAWLTYLISPIILLISTSLIALIIFMVVELYYVNDNNKKIKFKDTWRIVLTAQWSTVVAIFIKVLWFGFFRTQYTFEELQSFYPLSLINLYDVKLLEPWLKYPIQLINVFEFAYWIILVLGVKKLLQESWKKSFIVVFLSYGLSLIIWVVAIMFISINLSQV